MLDHETHVKIADELHQANIDRKPIPLLTKRYPDMVIEDSYAIQKIWADRQIEAGRRKAGHQIGLTSKAMQAATGIDEPDYGVMFDDQVFESGHVRVWRDYPHPRSELELAFVLTDDMGGPHDTIFDVLCALECDTPALEVRDAHVVMEGRTIIDTISDTGALGAMVLGGSPMKPEDIDLRWVGGALWRNQEIMETGLSAGILGHPANGVHWLANRLAGHDDYLEAGEIILAGSFTRYMWVYEGDTVFADFGPLGTIGVQFE